MKYEPKQVIKHKFDQSELDTIIQQKTWIYKNSVQGVGADKGVMISVVDDHGWGFLKQLECYFKQGYTLAEKPLPEIQPMFQRAYLTKPEKMQVADCKMLKIEAEEEYKNTLQARYEQHLAAIVAESKQRYETEQRKRAEKEAKEMEQKWMAEAMSVLGEAPLKENV